MIYIISLGPNNSSNIKEKYKEPTTNKTATRDYHRTKRTFQKVIIFLLKLATDFIQKMKISKIPNIITNYILR